MHKLLLILSSGLLLTLSAYGAQQVSATLQQKLMTQTKSGLIQNKQQNSYQYRYRNKYKVLTGLDSAHMSSTDMQAYLSTHGKGGINGGGSHLKIRLGQ